jgi:hypothetical protein
MSTSARPWHIRELPRVLSRFGTGLWRHRDPVRESMVPIWS